VYRLVTNTFIEEEIFNRASFKMGLDKLIIEAGLFNQKSTEQDRNEHLADLIRNKNTNEELNRDVSNNEQLNAILARNTDELHFYKELDK